MSGTPIVSVVIPTIRLDGMLHAAIESVETQTVRDRIEIVVVGDGLNDNDLAELARHNVRTVALGRRLGTPCALNEGIRASRGSLIARLDADDVANDQRIEKQLAAFDGDSELAVLASGARLIDESNRVIGRVEVPQGDIRVALAWSNPIVHSSVMYRRKVVTDAGGYHQSCRRMQDYELWLRLALAGHKFDALDESLVDYRVHLGQHSRNSPPRGPGFKRVRVGRRHLSRSMGSPWTSVLASDAAWTTVQWLRHTGLRRPSYERWIN